LGNGYDRNSTTNRVFVARYYTELLIVNRNITKMTNQVLEFKNVKHLDISYNKIKHIGFLPENLEELIIQKNEVVSLSKSLRVESLKYLNLSCNPIHDRCLEVINFCFPNLKCLDVSYCRLSKIQYSLSVLILMKKLRMLYLLGNPFTLIRGYLELMKTELPNIKF